MKKLTLLLLILSVLTGVSAQKSFFKDGEMELKEANDTLRVEVINNVMVLEVSVNDTPYRFILDTGAPTAISSVVKGEFSLVSERKVADPYGNIEEIPFLSIPKMAIGNVIFTDIVAMEYDMEVLDMFDAHGIIGANLMAKGAWEFDLKNEQIIVHREANFDAYPYASKLKFEATGTPLIHLKYFNDYPDLVVFDTGYNGLFNLSYKIFKKLKKIGLVEKEAKGEGALAKTAFTEEHNTAYKTKLKISTGNFELADIIAEVEENDITLIGSEFLNYYNTVFDFHNKKIYMKPYGNKPETTYSTVGAEFAMDDKKGLYVAFLWEDSEAASKGLSVGDRVLSINGIDSKPATFTNEKETLIFDLLKKRKF